MEQEEERLKRRRRVNRLKKLILIIIALLILIPTLFCLFLGLRLHSVNKYIKTIEQTNESLLSQNNTLESDNLAYLTLVKQLQAKLEGTDDITEPTKGISLDQITKDGGSDTEEETPQEEIRKVYLTFDDGPSMYTSQILDILAQYHVKATFFVVGKTAEQYVPLYQRIVEEGHTLGMHSFSHKYNEIYASKEAYVEDLTKLKDFLYETTGVECSFVRFPGGSSNTVSAVDMNELIAYLREQELTYFDWNISSGDATTSKLSANRIVHNCTDSLGKYDAAVILMHDAAERETTVLALPELIETIQAMDNTVLLPIDSNTELIQHIKNESEE